MDAQQILIEAGAIDNADIRPDETANVISGDARLCFGPSVMDGDGKRLSPPQGWDATEYERRSDDDGEYWAETGYTYAETDAEMTALAAKYA